MSTASVFETTLSRALEHRHLVGGQRRAREPLRQPGAGAGDGDRHVDEAPALAEHLRDRRGRARSSRPCRARRARRSGWRPPAQSSARAKYSATSSTQIGCDALPARADHRHDRRVAHLLHERRQRAAVAAEDEARTEDHVLEPRVGDRLLLRPLGGVVGDGVLRRLARPERAHQDEPPDAGVLRCGDEVLRALRHHALEFGGAALEDRDEVDHVRAARRSCGCRLAASVMSPAASSTPSARRCAARSGRRTSARTSRSSARSACTILLPDEPGRAGDERRHCGKFCQ